MAYLLTEILIISWHKENCRRGFVKKSQFTSLLILSPEFNLETELCNICLIFSNLNWKKI